MERLGVRKAGEGKRVRKIKVEPRETTLFGATKNNSE